MNPTQWPQAPQQYRNLYSRWGGQNPGQDGQAPGQGGILGPPLAADMPPQSQAPLHGLMQAHPAPSFGGGPTPAPVYHHPPIGGTLPPTPAGPPPPSFGGGPTAAPPAPSFGGGPAYSAPPPAFGGGPAQAPMPPSFGGGPAYDPNDPNNLRRLSAPLKSY